MTNKDKFEKLQSDFQSSQQVLTAIGHETRQLIIMVLIQAGCQGIRVGEITEKTHLSRPAVSHHLKILKTSGVVSVRKESTKNYYYLDPSSKLMNLKQLMRTIEELIEDHGKGRKKYGKDK
jgi:DNA-binding transcriptional ArsR family regulator